MGDPVASAFRVCVTTAAVAAVCDRRSLFFKCFGAHRAPLQLKKRRLSHRLSNPAQKLVIFVMDVFPKVAETGIVALP